MIDEPLAPQVTAEIGRLQTSEMTSRWNGAIGELEVAFVRAGRKGVPPDVLARAGELLAHGRTLVAKVERVTQTVAETQARVDRMEAHAREFRANLGRAIDELSRDRSRERAHRTALRARQDEVDPGTHAKKDDANVWEAAALSTEEDRSRAIEDDLSFQIVALQLQLDAKNERFEKDLAGATAELEGSISAVRAMTNELVRALDECASMVSAPTRRKS
jgi:hypothetical protein